MRRWPETDRATSPSPSVSPRDIGDDIENIAAWRERGKGPFFIHRQLARFGYATHADRDALIMEYIRRAAHDPKLPPIDPAYFDLPALS